MTSDRSTVGGAEMHVPLTPVTPTAGGVSLNPNATVFHSSKDGALEEGSDQEVVALQPQTNGVSPQPQGASLLNGESEPVFGLTSVTFPPTPDHSPEATNISSSEDHLSSQAERSDGGTYSTVSPVLQTTLNGEEGESPIAEALFPSPPTPTPPAHFIHDEAGISADALPLDKLKASLKHYLEYYFSSQNLAQDAYLVSQMDADQYVPIATIAKFNQVKRLTDNLDLVVEVLRDSPNVQVDEKGEKVRPVIHRCVVILREVPETTPKQDVENLFTSPNCPPFASCQFASSNCWYITFDSEEDAQKAYAYLRTEVQTFLGNPIMARIKAKPLIRYQNGPKPPAKIGIATPARQVPLPPKLLTPLPIPPPTFSAPPVNVQSISFISSANTTPVVSVSNLPFFPPPNTGLVWQNGGQQATVTYYDPSMAFAVNGYTAAAAAYKVPNPNTQKQHSFQSIRNNNNTYRNQKHLPGRYIQPQVTSQPTHHHPAMSTPQPLNHSTNQPSTATSTHSSNSSSPVVEASVSAAPVQYVELQAPRAPVSNEPAHTSAHSNHTRSGGDAGASETSRQVTHNTYSDQTPYPSSQNHGHRTAVSGTSTGAPNVNAQRVGPSNSANSHYHGNGHHSNANTGTAHGHHHNAAPLSSRHHHGNQGTAEPLLTTGSGSARHASEISVNAGSARHSHATDTGASKESPPRHTPRRERVERANEREEAAPLMSREIRREPRGEPRDPRGRDDNRRNGGEERRVEERRGGGGGEERRGGGGPTDDRGYGNRFSRPRRGGPRSGEQTDDNKRSVGSSTKEKPPEAFELQANSFPPLPGSLMPASASNGVYENKPSDVVLSDVVKGTAKPTVSCANGSVSAEEKEDSTQATTSQVSSSNEIGETPEAVPSAVTTTAKPATPPLSPQKISKATSIDTSLTKSSGVRTSAATVAGSPPAVAAKLATQQSNKATSTNTLGKTSPPSTQQALAHSAAPTSSPTHSNTHSANIPSAKANKTSHNKTNASDRTDNRQKSSGEHEKSTGPGPLSPPGASVARNPAASTSKVTTSTPQQPAIPPKMSYAAILQQKKAESEGLALGAAEFNGSEKSAEHSASNHDQSNGSCVEPGANSPTARNDSGQAVNPRPPTRTEQSRAKDSNANAGDYPRRGEGGESGRGGNHRAGGEFREFSRDNRHYYGNKDNIGPRRGGPNRDFNRSEREYSRRDSDREYRRDNYRGGDRGDRDGFRGDRERYQGDNYRGGENYREREGGYHRDSYRNDRDSYRGENSYRGGYRGGYRRRAGGDYNREVPVRE